MRSRNHTPRRLAVLLLTAMIAAAGPVPGDRRPWQKMRHWPQHETGVNAAGAFLCAEAAMAHGDFDFATSQYLLALENASGTTLSTAVQIVPRALVASLRAGRAEASVLAVKAARLNPENPLAQLQLASEGVAHGQWPEAAQHYASMSRDDAFGPMRAVLLAWAQYGAGRKDPLPAQVQGRGKDEAAPPDGGAFIFQRGLMADLADRPADAELLYRAAAADMGPGDFDLARSLASLQARQGHTAEAARTLAGLDNTELDLAVSLPRLQAEAAIRPISDPGDAIAAIHVAFARLARAQGAPDLADILLHLALTIRPHLTIARLWTASWLETDHHPAAALAALVPVDPDDPLAPSANMRRASVFAALGVPAQSLRILSALTATVPGRPEPWVQMGDVLHHLHREDEAAQAYAKALARVGPANPSSWHILQARAAAEAASGGIAAAEADYLTALKLAPDEPELLLDLGRFWTARGTSLPHARQLIARAAELRPQDAMSADSLGEVALREGDNEAAIRALEHAAELSPDDAEINRHLGDAYAAAGHRREAEIQWQRAASR